MKKLKKLSEKDEQSMTTEMIKVADRYLGEGNYELCAVCFPTGALIDMAVGKRVRKLNYFYLGTMSDLASKTMLKLIWGND